MKHCIKPFIAGIAFFSMFALSSSNAFAQCRSAGVCDTTALANVTNPERWVPADYVLEFDEEYVPGFENVGPPLCWPIGQPLGDEYEVGPLPEEPCGIDEITLLHYNTSGKRRRKKVRKNTKCIPFTGTAEYALGPVSVMDWWEDRGVGGCGQEVNKYTNWPTGKRCGPTSAAPTCQ